MRSSRPSVPTDWLDIERFDTEPFDGMPDGAPERHEIIGQAAAIRRSAAMHDTCQAIVGIIGGQQTNLMSPGQELLCESLDMAADPARVRVRVRGNKPYAHRSIVEQASDAAHFAPVSDRNFVKFTFVRVLPEWRRRSAEERERDKAEFAAACADFASDHLLRAYSLVGTRGDTDLMIRSLAPSLDPIHELHVLLNQSGLMRWAEISHSYLAMTKESTYADEPTPLEPRPGSDRKYLIVYPMWKKREWYLLPAEERMRIMRGHIETGKRTRASRSTPPTPTASTTRSSWSRSTPTSRASSSTSCRSCARPSRAPTRSPRRRSSRACRCRLRRRWRRWTGG